MNYSNCLTRKTKLKTNDNIELDGHAQRKLFLPYEQTVLRNRNPSHSKVGGSQKAKPLFCIMEYFVEAVIKKFMRKITDIRFWSSDFSNLDEMKVVDPTNFFMSLHVVVDLIDNSESLWSVNVGTPSGVAAYCKNYFALDSDVKVFWQPLIIVEAFDRDMILSYIKKQVLSFGDTYDSKFKLRMLSYLNFDDLFIFDDDDMEFFLERL